MQKKSTKSESLFPTAEEKEKNSNYGKNKRRKENRG